MDREQIAALTALIATIATISNIIISVLVLRHGTGQATRHFDEKIELALQRFEKKFEENLDRRFDLFVDSKSLGYQLKLLESSTNSEVKRIDYFAVQLDHRLTRNTQIVTMMLDLLLRNFRVDESTKRELQTAKAESRHNSPSSA